ncbi:MAG: hypothetical protein JNK85_25215 [Verrucomicrobiales bacterium]|nr:hypothetical protein [Verrucomicrobiales bacterium]
MIAHSAAAQEAKMAYQGRLTESGLPANGLFEMRFGLFDTPDTGTGTRQGAEVSVSDVAAENGVFTALLDFGVSVFDGTPRFLEISVRRAGSTNSFATLSPRQAITPVPYAIRTLSATPVPGGVQSDGSGNVAVGTAVFPPGIRLNVEGATRVSPGGNGGLVQIGTPNGETGLTIAGTNRVDLRFNRDTLTLAAGSNSGPPPPWNGLTLNTNGNVGIGLASLASNSLWKLEVNGPTRITPVGAAGGAIQFSTPNSETGMSILGRNRADLRFDDASVKLVAGPGNGPPGNSSGLSIDLHGRVGIGTSSPTHTLSVAGSASVADRLQVGPVLLPSAMLEVASAGQPAIRAESANRDIPAVSASGLTHGRAIHADGHVTQGRINGGFVKAMVVISGLTIQRCFNGVGDESTTPELTQGNCGISISKVEADSYVDSTYIDFGFRVTDRFIIVTPGQRSNRLAVANLFYAPRGIDTEIAVVVGLADGEESGADAPIPFTVVVF